MSECNIKVFSENMEDEQIEEKIKEYEELQIAIQNFTAQKLQLEQQKEEYKNAEKSLQEATGKVYIEIGGFIVEASKEEAMASLKEKLDSSEMRLNIIAKQLDETKKKEESLREALDAELQPSHQ